MNYVKLVFGIQLQLNRAYFTYTCVYVWVGACVGAWVRVSVCECATQTAFNHSGWASSEGKGVIEVVSLSFFLSFLLSLDVHRKSLDAELE